MKFEIKSKIDHFNDEKSNKKIFFQTKIKSFSLIN